MSKKGNIFIKNVIHYATGEKINVLIEKGKIKKISSNIRTKVKSIDAKGKLVGMPGLVDIHTHTRYPGQEYKEDLNSVAKSASAGGYTTIVAMANTIPPMDNVLMVKGFYAKAQDIEHVNLLTYGAVTSGRKGETLVEMATMADAGVVGFSDDGDFIVKSDVMRRALEYAKVTKKVIISHPEDTYLTENGQINESIMSQSLGMTGIPAISESIAVYRDAAIAAWVEGKLHLAHISSSESLEVLNLFKKHKNITAETAPHYLYFSDEDLKTFDTNFKMKPPLRRPKDREALKKALKRGLLQVIATDHAPHAFYEKNLEFNYAPFGIVGLETAFSSVYEVMVKSGLANYKDIIDWMSFNPATIIGKEINDIKEGDTADIILFDPNKKWKVIDFYSKSSNSPWADRNLIGKIVYTIKDGVVVYND